MFFEWHFTIYSWVDKEVYLLFGNLVPEEQLFLMMHGPVTSKSGINEQSRENVIFTFIAYEMKGKKK